MLGAGRGVAKDPDASRNWLTRAANAGLPMAQGQLGMMYLQGKSVDKNRPEAVRWLRAAAERGYPPAQGLLGILYDEGNGVEKNPVEAQFWWSVGAKPDPSSPLAKLREASRERLTAPQRAEVERRVKAWQPIPSQVDQPTVGRR